LKTGSESLVMRWAAGFFIPDGGIDLSFRHHVHIKCYGTSTGGSSNGIERPELESNYSLHLVPRYIHGTPVRLHSVMLLWVTLRLTGTVIYLLTYSMVQDIL